MWETSKASKWGGGSDATVIVIHNQISPGLPIYGLQVFTYSFNQVILEGSFDDLMEKIWG